jgi:hypothetical protein
MFSRARVLVLAAVVSTLAGCQEKSSESSRAADVTDAGVEKAPSKVEQAVAKAVKAGAVPVATNNAGPPADGIMDSARAESEVALGTVPKLTVGTEGSGQKALLRNAKATLPKSVSVELTIQAGMEQGLPPIRVTVGLESKKSDTAYLVVAKIQDVQVSMPNVPAEFTQQLAGLKGGTVSFSLSSQGAGFGFKSELAKGAKAELRELLEAVAEGLSLYTVPVPSVPVGVGAVWMVASRDSSSGFGLISYRMVKLLSVTDKGAELEYDARRYAVGRAIDASLLPPGSPPGSLREMSAGAKATFKISVDRLLATEMESSTALRGSIDAGDGVGPQGQPSQRAFQSGTGYRIIAAK